MNHLHEILCAKNELENQFVVMQNKLGLSEEDMLVVVEMISNSIRYKALVKISYDAIQREIEKGDTDNGNSNEKGQ